MFRAGIMTREPNRVRPWVSGASWSRHPGATAALRPVRDGVAFWACKGTPLTRLRCCHSLRVFRLRLHRCRQRFEQYLAMRIPENGASHSRHTCRTIWRRAAKCAPAVTVSTLTGFRARDTGALTGRDTVTLTGFGARGCFGLAGPRPFVLPLPPQNAFSSMVFSSAVEAGNIQRDATVSQYPSACVSIACGAQTRRIDSLDGA